jgi:hypothetical protein
MLVGALQVGDTAVGLVVFTARPESSTVTHNDVEGHETPLRLPTPSIFTGALQVGLAAVRVVVVTAFPSSSTATHREIDGRETP